jgi:predicted nucleic acid-binding protein
MARAEAWFMCRVGFVETSRAVGLTAGSSAVRSFRTEWPAFGVIEIDQQLVERATELALAHQLRSLDALHLAAALLLPDDEFTVATWDRRLHAAAGAEGRTVFPEACEAEA